MEESLWTSLRQNSKAVLWSLLYCIGVIIAGFNPQLISSLLAVPAFQKDFGVPVDAGYAVAAPWQLGFNIAVPVGQILGSLLVAKPMDRWGRKLAFACCAVLTAVGVVVQVTATSKLQLLFAEILNGIVRGAYPVLASTYITEITPVSSCKTL